VPLLCAGTGELRHGTEGWKCLETSLRALQQLLGGLPAAAVAAAADEEVLQLTFRYVCMCAAGDVAGTLAAAGVRTGFLAAGLEGVSR
jgi:hypothetical protein